MQSQLPGPGGSPFLRRIHGLFALAALILAGSTPAKATAADLPDGRYLFVATPGIRNYLEYGGHGILVFDIDHGHRFVKRIASSGYDEQRRPLNVKGVCASAATGRLYVSTLRHLICFDLVTERIVWEREYEGGCDRMAIAPDGRTIYLPSLEKAHWHVVDAATGDILARLEPDSGAHNTLYSRDGKHAYLAGLRSPLLRVTDTTTHRIIREVGPFGSAIRPFTVNGRATLCFVNVNGLLGFEVGDLQSGQRLHRVEVQGYKMGVVKRHGCPSHGIGLSPDERELWLVDAANSRVHVFDATTMPPRQLESVALRDQPGWVTFTEDGRYCYPSTGDVIERATRRIVATLRDETGADVQSEKMVEIEFKDGKPVRTADQFGVGRMR